jgi:transcriptional regulator with XRE-family HTH domain
MPRSIPVKKKRRKKTLDQRLAERIGRRIKKLRQRQGISQKELGSQIGLGQDAISLFERGKRCPCVPQLVRLAVMLNGDVSEWLNLRNSMPSSPNRDLF